MLIEATLLGLSAGSYCLFNCAPAAVPMFLSEDKRPMESVMRLVKFLAGRLAGYLIFGFLIGILGAYAVGYLDPFIQQRIESYVMVILGLFLLFSGLSKKGLVESCLLKKVTAGRSLPIVVVGVLTGLSFCPPFFAAASRVFGKTGSIGGLIYFFFFFLGTSVYMLPLGGFFWFSRFKKASMFISTWLRILIGAYFVIVLGLFAMITPGGA